MLHMLVLMCVHVGVSVRHEDRVCIAVYAAGKQCDNSVCCCAGKTCSLSLFELNKTKLIDKSIRFFKIKYVLITCNVIVK